MTEIVTQARQAREKLAAALALLQTPEAGNLIDSVAEPVARAMGALHQIESSAGASVATNGPLALDSVRAALGLLQAQPSNATADQATEHIAGSLGMVHGLAEHAKQSAAAQAPTVEQRAPDIQPAPPVQPAPVQPVQPAVAQKNAALDSTKLAPAHNPAFDRTQRASDPAPAAPSGGLDVTLPTPMRPESFKIPALDSTQASVRDPGVVSRAPQAASLAPSSKVASAPPVAMPEGALQIEANLGAHSPTNFYKGLSGNDVVDDGGLFVATYDIPPLGTQLWVAVHMPGGYQFEGLAEVRWTRETGAGDAPPGFGCGFKSLSKEARQLIYRYVRNREPLFHDDL